MSEMSAIPRRRLAIVTCMDARVDPQAVFGLQRGDAHVLRNAGALVSEDVLRSLLLSQRLLETRSIAIVAHTDCGLAKFRDQELAARITEETGEAPPFALGAFVDLDQHVTAQLERVRGCTWLTHVDDVRGYVLDVADGSLRSVDT